MTFTIADFFQLLGSLGLFLYGMNLMSESLQKVAGNRLRKILASMTKNRFLGVLTGLLITSIIQSSSATTVMVVSFVNAGLLTLAESISVIMGANIGTTVTAWLVSLIGFQFSIVDLAIPVIGISIPLMFSKNDKRKSTGEFLVGFALLFMGLDFLKNSVPDLESHPEALAFVKDFASSSLGTGYGAVFLFLLIGTVLTIIVQSSSATMAITLVMLNNGWITFEMAAAMVLGENIGTTITANLAAIPANATAKRAALSHTLFNVFGVMWMLIVFYPFIHLMDWIVTLGGNAESQNSNLYALSMFHTMFNVTNTCIMVWLVKYYVIIVNKIIPVREQDSEFSLRFIKGGLLQTGELSLIEAEKEIELYAQRSHRMFDEARTFAMTKFDDKNNQNYAERIEQFEDASDRTELAIANYMYEIAATPTSTSIKNKIRNYLYLTTEIESVADRCFNISRTVIRRNNDKINFTADQNADLERMFSLISQQLDALERCVSSRFSDEESRGEIFRVEKDINELRYALKSKNVDQVNNGDHSYESGIHFMDVIEDCESLGDAVTKIAREVKI